MAGPPPAGTLCVTEEASARDEEADRDSRRRNGRHDDREPLRRRFDLDEAEIHVVHRDDRHVYQPCLVFGSFGLAGVRLQPEETEGLSGPGWNERVFTFYDPEGAAALHGALERFAGGRLVVNLVDMPIKCPVAPLELAFVADWYFRERGIREKVELGGQPR